MVQKEELAMTRTVVHPRQITGIVREEVKAAPIVVEGELTMFVIDLRSLKQLRLRVQAVVFDDGALGFIELGRSSSRKGEVGGGGVAAVLAHDDPAIVDGLGAPAGDRERDGRGGHRSRRTNALR
jgi:hypothetical protein